MRFFQVSEIGFPARGFFRKNKYATKESLSYIGEGETIILKNIEFI